MARDPVTEGPSPSLTDDSDRKRGREYLASVSRGVVGKGLGLLRTFLILPLITPAEFGLYRYILIFITYLNHLHLGAFHYISVEYPQRRGAGDEATLNEMRVAAWQVTVAGSAVAALALIVFATTIPLSWPLAMVLAAMLAFQLPSSYVVLMMRVREEFGALATIEFIADVLSTLIVIGATYTFGLPGLLVSAMHRAVILTLLGRKTLAPPGWSQVNWCALRAIVKRGLRIWTSTFFADVVSTIDLVLLTALLGEGHIEIGFFALAVSMMTHVDGITAPISQIELIKVARRDGASGRDRAALLRDLEQSLARDSLICMILTCMAAASIGLLIVLVPRYEPALPVIAALLPATVIRRWRKYGTFILSLTERLRWANACSLVSLGVLSGGYLGIHAFADDNLRGYALVSCAGGFVFGASLLFVSAAIVAGWRAATRLLLRLSLVHLPLLLFCFVGIGFPPTLGIVGAAAVVLLSCLLAFRALLPHALRDAWQFSVQLVRRKR